MKPNPGGQLDPANIDDTDGKYAFRFPLIRRWWRFDRSLAPANS
jgi:hypothetical protein